MDREKVIQLLAKLAEGRFRLRRHIYRGNIKDTTESYFIGLTTAYLRAAAIVGIGDTAKDVISAVDDISGVDINANDFQLCRIARDIAREAVAEEVDES